MNQNVTWQEADLAQAFIQKGEQHGVHMTPETAMDLAKEIRGKAKLGDILDLTSVIRETVEKLFPSNPDVAVATASIEDVLSVTARKVKAYQTKLAEGGPITPEEEEELRGGILNDVIIPMQEGVSEKVAEATRKTMHELLPLQREKNEIEEYLSDENTIDRLYDEWQADPTNKEKKKAYQKEKSQRDSKILQAFELLKKINVLKSRLIMLDAANGYVKRDLSVIDQYRGADGMSSYFDKVLQPTIKNIRDVVFKIRKEIVLPEVSAKDRHSREWLMRHHHTKSYQSKTIGPSVDAVSLDEFSQSPIYKELEARGMSEQQIGQSIDNLNSKPMTWRKGNAIYMLLDPPAEKTINKDIPTMMEDAPKSWAEEVITNQPFNLEKGKFEDKDLERGTKPRAMTKERKLAEAANEKAHWSVLMNLAKNQRVDKSGKTRAEQYVETLPETLVEEVNKVEESLSNVKSTKYESAAEIKSRILDSAPAGVKHVLDQIQKMEEEDMLHDKEIITAAIMNPSIPDWVLMRAAVTGYATDIRRLAKAILKRRGWVPKLDENGHLAKDPETKDFIWVKAPGLEASGSMDDDDEFIHAFGQASDQYNMQRQGYQDQINAIDEQMKTMTGQMEQLRIRKQDLEKQRDSVKKAPTTQQPTMQAAPAQAPAGASGPAPAPGMAAMSPLSFRKLS